MKKTIVHLVSLAIVFSIVSASLSGFAALPGQQPGPIVDEYKIVKITDQSVEIAALRAGTIHFTEVVTDADIAALRSEGFKIVAAGSFEVVTYLLNCKDRTPTNDTKFRRAIAHLIPKDTYLQAVGALGRYEYDPCPATSFWHNPNLEDPTTFDPVLASAMLDNAGYTKGQDGWRIDPATGQKLREFQIVGVTEYPPYLRTVHDLWKAELEKVGIPATVELVQFAGGAWYVKLMVNRDFDAFLIGIGGNTPADLEMLMSATRPVLPISGWNNSRFDQLGIKASSVIDEPTVREAAYEMQQIMLDQMPEIVMFNTQSNVALGKDMLGFAGTPVTSATTLYPCQIATLRYRFKTGVGGSLVSPEISDPTNLIQDIALIPLEHRHSGW